ncbi:MAG: bifunctional chorismate mutase/prephenate dehydrogenase [Methanomassiliicoccales archaeon]
MTDSVDGIRWKIEELDNEILDLIEKRMKAALYMGNEKARKGLPVRNERVEDQVIERYLERAEGVGISKAAAKEIATILIQESVDAQGRLPRPGRRQDILVIGTGKMGQWFVRFLTGRGHKVNVCDTRPSKADRSTVSLKVGVRNADMIIIATPIPSTKQILEDVLALKPKGTVLDITSIKDSIIPTMRAAAAGGLEVCSIHPMFGPEASVYNRSIVICDCGSNEAMDKAAGLFDGAGAKMTRMPVEEHDELMSYVLGLSHAVNIAFFRTLTKSGKDFGRLDQVSSTTFRSQAATSKRVANESPELYYNIQHLNPHSKHCLELFLEAVGDIEAFALDEDEKRFVEMMKEGKEYFGED